MKYYKVLRVHNKKLFSAVPSIIKQRYYTNKINLPLFLNSKLFVFDSCLYASQFKKYVEGLYNQSYCIYEVEVTNPIKVINIPMISVIANKNYVQRIWQNTVYTSKITFDGETNTKWAPAGTVLVDTVKLLKRVGV